MPTIPSFILRKLYVKGSLRATHNGFAFDLKNTIAPGTITALNGLTVDGCTISPDHITVHLPGRDEPCRASEISDRSPLRFDVGAAVTLQVADYLKPGAHEFIIHVLVREIGPLNIPASDTLT